VRTGKRFNGDGGRGHRRQFRGIASSI
jgi:hypothetical protein